MDEAIRIEEKYLAAATSSHLRLNLERGCDVDLLIAAGLVRESLATELYRLRGEFDAMKAPLKLGLTNYRDMHARAAEHRDLAARAARAKGKVDALAVAEHERAAEEFAQRADEEALTARALILMQLKSLSGVTMAVGQFADAAAQRRGFDGHVDVRRTAGRALDLMLDPLCPHCDGVGSHGGYGKARNLCTKCKGSTRRRVDFGSIEAQAFGLFLLAELERKLFRVDGLMLKFLRQVRDGETVVLDPKRVNKPSAELQRRLAELRGRQANAD